MEIHLQQLPDNIYQYLESRCISKDAADSAKLGWLENHYGFPWICLPVLDAQGATLGAKLRRPPDSKAEQKTMFVKGTKASLYGLQYLHSNLDKIIICEGEFDVLCLISQGIEAVCSTAGAGTFKPEWTKLFPEGVEIIVCYDRDEAGKKGAEKVLQIFAEHRPEISIKVADLPDDLGEGGDITDLALRCKEKNLDFNKEFSNCITKNSLPETPSRYEGTGVVLEDVLERTRKIGLVNDFLVEVVLATYISKELEARNPIWLMMVGNPSSNKTVLVTLLKGSENTFMLDTMTANPFISGMHNKDKPQDLLPLLDGKCFIVKDYTSFFGRSEETVKQLLSDLVSIYDGEYSKHSGARGTVRYEASFSHIGCVTPMGLKMRQQYMNMVGARFLTIRVPELTQEQREDSFGIAWSPDLLTNIKDASECARAFVNSISKKLREDGVKLEEEPVNIQTRLNRLAELTARARGEVRTRSRKFEDDDGNEKSYQELEDVQVEEPFRALHQLKALCRSLAILRGKDVVTIEEVNTARLVAMSSMPVQRAEALSVFEKSSKLSAKEAAEILDKNYSSVKRHLDELRHLRVLERSKAPDGKTWLYYPSERFVDVITSENVL